MLLEAQRIEQRTRFDMEMMRELGYCNGIENYSRILDGRPPGSLRTRWSSTSRRTSCSSSTRSHQTIPQLHGMYAGDRSRKETLVEYGFACLPPWIIARSSSRSSRSWSTRHLRLGDPRP
jgi:excinuclease ABC subunit B